MPGPIVSHSCFQDLKAFHSLLAATHHLPPIVAGESDHTSNIVGHTATSGSRSGVAAESKAASSASSSTMADQAIAMKEIPPLYDY
jgi:hypothetical protein